MELAHAVTTSPYLKTIYNTNKKEKEKQLTNKNDIKKGKKKKIHLYYNSTIIKKNANDILKIRENIYSQSSLLKNKNIKEEKKDNDLIDQSKSILSSYNDETKY